jgi:CheY-like chemotaxis protein
MIPPTRSRLLLVDDDPGTVMTMAQSLSAHYDIQFVLSGEEALARIAQQTPDLILLDRMMPGMDGLAVLAALRAGNPPCPAPVLMVTARTDEENEHEARAAGAADILHKPIDPLILQQKVAALLDTVVSA